VLVTWLAVRVELCAVVHTALLAHCCRWSNVKLIDTAQYGPKISNLFSVDSREG